MQELPHYYVAAASTRGTQNISVSSEGLPDLDTAGPPQYGGPGDVWSPETMLVGSVANCYILTFRAIARAAKLDWLALECDVEGTLDKIEKVTQFTEFKVQARLTVPEGTRLEKAHTILEKAEKYCLITNSMTGEFHLDADVQVESVEDAAESA